MKVIIQDAKTKRYYSEAGNWVTEEAEARDFSSLIRAYNFARRFTSRRFAVVLFCPDDNYLAQIIEGEGAAEEAIPQAVAAATTAAPVKKVAKQKIAAQKKPTFSSVWSRFNACMTSSRNYLN